MMSLEVLFCHFVPVAYRPVGNSRWAYVAVPCKVCLTNDSKYRLATPCCPTEAIQLYYKALALCERVLMERADVEVLPQ